MTKLCFVLIILMALSACTTIKDKAPVIAISSTLAEQLPCYAAFEALDKLAFQSAGTLIGNRIPTMPWLRHNRLITHDVRTQSNSAGVSKLLQRMSSLASQGLSYELETIPKKPRQNWQKRYHIKRSPSDFAKWCSNQLVNQQLESPLNTLDHLKSIPEDNDYSKLARMAGLYPLAAIPFRLGVVKEQRQLAEEWGQISGKQWFRYQPELARNNQGASENWRLIERHAPTWLIDNSTPANLPGTPYWQGKQLKVNTRRATTYAFVSEARWKQQPITQLNYVIWFTERPRLKRFDWVAGQHDAVVFRVNLTQRGEVIAYDSIHLCGCWYRLFLPEGRPYKKLNRYWREPVLMQRIRLPARSDPRMAIYLQANTHQIQFVQPITEVVEDAQKVTSITSYQLQPFSQLLKLPTASGVRPVFNWNGYISGSERPERWLFWPMGVKNPGALRRFGNHAISFVGRRYFDDPHLLEKVSGLK